VTWQSLAVVTAYERVNAVGLTSILDLGLFFWFRLASLTDVRSRQQSEFHSFHFILPEAITFAAITNSNDNHTELDSKTTKQRQVDVCILL